MSILGNLNNLIDEEPQGGGFKVPSVAKKEKETLSLEKCVAISTALHPAVAGLVALLVFVLMLMGINLFMLERPKPKTQDIEFVLVDKEATPINKNTKYRADRNSRAGGKHNPKQKVSLPSASTKKSPTVAPRRASQPTKAPAKTQSFAKKIFSQAKSEAPQAQTSPSPAKPAPPSVRPSLAPPSAPKINTNAKAPIGLPAPPSMETGKSYSTGPVGGSSGKSKTLASSGGGSRSGGHASSAPSTGSRGGSGSAGNPGPGNPNGPIGIDALREPNFAPYMRELQSRIKYNWDPPKGNESKRVVLMFRIAKNGQLLSNRVSKSSGMAVADRAALNAVEVTAPFKPLPAEFRGQYIDIQFTFDYNVFGATGY